VEVLVSMELGTALVEERMERKSDFENRQLDLDRLLAAIPASPSASDVSSEHINESGLAPGGLSTCGPEGFFSAHITKGLWVFSAGNTVE
jgi:hypothetical protein